MKCVGEQKLRNEKLKNPLQSRIYECKKRIGRIKTRMNNESKKKKEEKMETKIK